MKIQQAQALAIDREIRLKKAFSKEPEISQYDICETSPRLNDIC